MNYIFLYLSLVSAGTFASIPRMELDLSKTKNLVEFLATANPTAAKIRGDSNFKLENGVPLRGQIAIDGKQISGETTFVLDALKTGIDMRDRHMKEKYLETKKFPEAKLKLVEFNLPEAFTGTKLEKKAIPFRGDLTLHGLTKPIQGTADFLGEGKKVALSFSFNIKISDFSIPEVKFFEVSLADEVQISVNLEGNSNSAN